MGKAPRPTRAEAGDVANAVLDGTDCVMLSGETAGGDFPVEAVTIMRRLVEEAEGALDFNSVYMNIRESVKAHFGGMAAGEAMASTAVKTAIDCGAAALVVVSRTGGTARLAAKYRPCCPIIAVTDSEYIARFLQTSRGVVSQVAVLKEGGVELDAETKILPSSIAFAKKIGIKGMESSCSVVLLAEDRGRVYSKICKVP
jgi:pyruvate kinase